MQAKEISKDIYDVDGLLDERFGKEGTPEREQKQKTRLLHFILVR